jgi:hypothetical protein
VLARFCFAAYDMALAEHYEENLVAFIKALRLHFKAPNAKFVAATLGQTLQVRAAIPVHEQTKHGV